MIRLCHYDLNFSIGNAQKWMAIPSTSVWLTFDITEKVVFSICDCSLIQQIPVSVMQWKTKLECSFILNSLPKYSIWEVTMVIEVSTNTTFTPKPWMLSAFAVRLISWVYTQTLKAHTRLRVFSDPYNLCSRLLSGPFSLVPTNLLSPLPLKWLIIESSCHFLK